MSLADELKSQARRLIEHSWNPLSAMPVSQEGTGRLLEIAAEHIEKLERSAFVIELFLKGRGRQSSERLIIDAGPDVTILLDSGNIIFRGPKIDVSYEMEDIVKGAVQRVKK